MRLASFNLENLFQRAKALDLATWSEGKAALDLWACVNATMNLPVYSAADKQSMLLDLEQLGILTRSNAGSLRVNRAPVDASRWGVLRENRGSFLDEPKSGDVEVAASGRDDWVGWVDLESEVVDETATRMTARVIADVAADVIAVVEVESRPALTRFNRELLADRYTHAMCIDGNDERGIDVGLYTRAGYEIATIVSHVDDLNPANNEPVFSRDCPELLVRTPGGHRVLVLVNHLKSKGFGSTSASAAKRLVQAQRVRSIYDQRRGDGHVHIAVVGDFNDTPDSAALAPLLAQGSDLRDIFTHPRFQSDGRPGTFGNATAASKIDYILLSPALWDAVTLAGVERRGVWGGKNGTLFPHYPEITAPQHAASDHAAIWVDLRLA